MTFLNPLVLLALAAGSIPLLLHLLNLRKLKTIDFSSVQFLKELQRTRIRRVKLRQLLLLLLRIGLVVFAVLAFARPTLKSSIGLPGAHASTTAIILVDNSFSMSVRDNYGERFRQAKAAALRIVESLESGDEAVIVPMAGPNAMEALPSRNRESLRQSIEQMQLGYARAGVSDALHIAAQKLELSANLNKEVYLITDMQASNLASRIDSMHVFDEATRAYVMPVGSSVADASENLGIDSLAMTSAMYEPGSSVSVRVWIHNYGANDAKQVPVRMYFGRDRQAAQAVSVSAGASVAVDLIAETSRGGLFDGYVEIASDAMEQDNRRYFAFKVPDKLRVAVVGNPATTRYLDMVFAVANRSISFENVDPSAVGALDPNRVSAIVLADAAIPASEAARIGRFVDDGGGVVIYAGDNSAGASGLSAIRSIGVSVSSTVQTGDTTTTSALKLGGVAKDHPLFAGVFDKVNSGRVELTASITRALPAIGGQSVIALTNGTPFVSEFRRGRGRIIYVAVPPNMVWSNLPVTDIFVPIAIRSVLYVGATGNVFPSVKIGEVASVSLSSSQRVDDKVQVLTPTKRESFVGVTRVPAGTSVRYQNTSEPGVYRVRQDSKEIALFSVNVSDAESNLTPTTKDRLLAHVSAMFVQPQNVAMMNSQSGDFFNAIRESRIGLELWKYMLALALLCAFTEMIVSRQGKEPGAEGVAKSVSTQPS